MPEGYTTLDYLARALRKNGLPGDAEQEPAIAVDAITAETEPLEKSLKRHWYAPDGSDILDDADEIDIPTEPKSRDDEYDLPTGTLVHGDSERNRFRYRKNSDALLESDPRNDRWREDRREPKREIRLAFGDRDDDSRPAYTRIRLDRRDVTEINELLVVNSEGGFDDWVDSDEYDGGVGKQHQGEDYWVRVNNGGWSELYLDIHAMDGDLASLANAVYVDIDYGHEGIPENVRRAVALRAGAELVEDAVIEIPQNATIYNIETKAEQMREKADDLLSVYTEDDKNED